MKDKIIIRPTPTGKNMFYSMVMDAKTWDNPTWSAIDWCAGYGNIRGEVIKKESNVTHVRFKTVGAGKDS